MVEKYLMGRQLCVIAIVFFISQLTNFPSMPSVLPNGLQNLFIDTGLPGVMLTLILGQLFPQLIADEYTIRFLNIKGSLLFIQIAEGLEQIGILTNCSWVVAYGLTHYIFRWSGNMAEGSEEMENPLDKLDLGASTHNLLLKLKGAYHTTSSASDSDHASSTSNSTDQGKDIELSNFQNGNNLQKNLDRYEEYNTTPTSTTSSSNTLFAFHANATVMSIEQMNPCKSGLVTSSTTLLKLLVSTFVTVIAATIVIYGMFFQKPLLNFPPVALLFILGGCMVSEFYLEGLQVAVLAIQHRDQTRIPSSLTGAVRIHEYLNMDRKAEVVKRFLIGRQFLVVFSMFTMASITSYESFEHFDVTLLPRKMIGLFVLSGFCGVIFALNTVQLPAQILAKQYPLLFLNLPGAYYVLRLTLCIEQSGLLHFGWVLFHCSKGLFQYE